MTSVNLTDQLAALRAHTERVGGIKVVRFRTTQAIVNELRGRNAERVRVCGIEVIADPECPPGVVCVVTVEEPA